MNGEYTFGDAIQALIDKSKTSPKAQSLTLFPIPMTALNFIECERKEYILKHRACCLLTRLLYADWWR